MTLGQRIAALRALHHLSQGDLAEKCNVSRQSVSKWETDASIPDLDKLLTLGEVFAVTLDELVKGDRPAEEPPAPLSTAAENTPPAPPAKTGGTQRTLGFVLLAAALFGALLGLGVNVFLLFPAAYLAVCGVICLCVKKHAGLTIGWATFLPCAWLMPRMMGGRMGMVFVPSAWQYASPVPLAVAAALWFLLLGLIVGTVRAVRRARKDA